jgi:uncharacterized membrane protein
MLKTVVAALVGFMLLDGVWLGLLMKNFYRDQLTPIARLANGGFAPIWPAAILVYVLLALGVALFVLPRSTGVGSVAGFGALFGLVVYGVYDLTNFATLADYPLAITVVDVCWGTVATALCSVAVRLVQRVL